MQSLAAYMPQQRHRLEILLNKKLNSAGIAEPRLAEAMAYAVLDGGKRLRPLLAYASAEALGAAAESADVAACALEMVHAYSLIHDDLPAMDDDRLRRGKPTCHIRFDEATAILAGDALQALAFELLATDPALKVGHGTRLRMLAMLSRAAGAAGMVAGQSLDINAAGLHPEHAALARMHRLKTGALIRASVLLGALSSNIATASQLNALAEFADCIGLAFQIRDDILDVKSDTATLGKEQGRDQLLGKPTYVSLLGVAEAQRQCDALLNQAEQALQPFAGRATRLAQLTQYIATRTH